MDFRLYLTEFLITVFKHLSLVPKRIVREFLKMNLKIPLKKFIFNSKTILRKNAKINSYSIIRELFLAID